MNTETDLVSVIIPVYNVENYLDRCLESVINQDYTNIELILVDDGSTDNSGLICDKWAEKYSGIIRVVHQANQGASIARKTAIHEARGEFLTFVDSDDYVLPQYISALYQAATDNHAKVAVCPCHKVSGGHVCDYSLGLKVNNRCMGKDELFKRFFKYEFWGFWGGIYQKSLFDDIVFPIATINEDYFVKAQIFSKVDYIGYCTQPLYIYETHPGSLSHQSLSLKALGEFDNTVATWDYICNHAPQYAKHALAIAAEASCKLLTSLNKDNSNDYDEYRRTILDFLDKNLFRILLNSYLLWKVKLRLCISFLMARK